jgi:Tfp pilus assembly protein PilF
MKIKIAIFVLFIILECAVCLCADNDTTWPEGWQYRLALSVDTAKDTVPIERTAVFAFSGKAKDDGSDIRITDADGSEIPYFLVSAGPGNVYTVCFAAEKDVYYLYYGNPSAPAPAGTFSPRRGLFLETYVRRGDKADTWEDCQKIIKDSVKESLMTGRGFRGRIWDSINPFSAERNIVKVYTGFFYLHSPETINFGTTSTGPSFILVDDKLVAQWPGWHWIEAFIRPEHAGSIDLQAGLHKLVYYQIGQPWWNYAVCAMKRADDKQHAVIPEDFFLPVVTPKLLSCEKRNSHITAMFSWHNINYLYRERWELITMQFTDLSAPSQEITQWEWDFGDGQKSSEKNPAHTYLRNSIYPVTLKVQGKSGYSDTISLKIKAEQDFSNLLLDWYNPRTRDQYIEEFGKFNLGALGNEELFILAGIYNSYGLPEMEFACYDILKDRNLPPDEQLKAALLAADIALELKNYSASERIYKKILAEKTDHEISLKLGRLYLESNNLDAAETVFNGVSGSKDVPEKILRRARIGLADVLRYRGESEKAKEAYDKLTSPEAIGSKNGTYAQLVLFYLRNKDFATAIEKIEAWGEDVPIAKIKGNWSISFARAYLLKKDYEKALRELETFRRICKDKDNTYLPVSVYVTAEIYEAMGDKEKAQQWYAKVVSDYPGSAVARNAEEKLKSFTQK